MRQRYTTYMHCSLQSPDKSERSDLLRELMQSNISRACMGCAARLMRPSMRATGTQHALSSLTPMIDTRILC